MALETISKNISWDRKWCQLCENLGVQFYYNASITILEKQQNMVLTTINNDEHIANTLKAKNSQNHAGYLLLNYGIVSYINDKNSQYFISIILRARGELLNLNGKSFNSTAGTLCSLCNLNLKKKKIHIILLVNVPFLIMIELSILVKMC